jgi:hypothetical protein
LEPAVTRPKETPLSEQQAESYMIDVDTPCVIVSLVDGVARQGRTTKTYTFREPPSLEVKEGEAVYLFREGPNVIEVEARFVVMEHLCNRPIWEAARRWTDR